MPGLQTTGSEDLNRCAHLAFCARCSLCAGVHNAKVPETAGFGFGLSQADSPLSVEHSAILVEHRCRSAEIGSMGQISVGANSDSPYHSVTSSNRGC